MRFLVAFIFTTLIASPALADGAAAVPPQMSPFTFILGTVNFFLFGFLVYFIVYLRPQQQKEEEHKKFLASLKQNDEVLTRGGVLGKVSAVKPEQITIEVANGVKLRVHPSYVLSVSAK
jgi:preprotein translocase subunit YajC